MGVWCLSTQIWSSIDSSGVEIELTWSSANSKGHCSEAASFLTASRRSGGTEALRAARDRRKITAVAVTHNKKHPTAKTVILPTTHEKGGVDNEGAFVLHCSFNASMSCQERFLYRLWPRGRLFQGNSQSPDVSWTLLLPANLKTNNQKWTKVSFFSEMKYKYMLYKIRQKKNSNKITILWVI